MSRPDRRRRRLPQRRQEHAGQPAGRRQRGGDRAPSPASPATASGWRREWNGVAFELVDTGGIDLEDEAELARDVQRQARLAIAEADAVLMVVDGRAGLRAGDAELAKTLRGGDVPVLVASTRPTAPTTTHVTAEFHALGLGEPLAVSATHGLGTGDLLDAIVDALGERAAAAGGRRRRPGRRDRPPQRRQVLARQRLPRLRPGDRLRPRRHHPRRDRHRARGRRPPRSILVDTAGLRRRSKVAGTVDYYAQLRSERAVERADVAIVVCDASEGVTSEDLRVAEMAMKAGCATLLVLNKWDVDRDRHRRRPRPGRAQAAAAPGGDHLLGDARAQRRQRCCRGRCELADRAAERIPTPELNRFVADVVAKTPPPSRRGRRLRLYYAAQVGERPPRVAIQVNDRKLIVRDWAYHLENRMRETYELGGRAAGDRLRPRIGRRGYAD